MIQFLLALLVAVHALFRTRTRCRPGSPGSPPTGRCAQTQATAAAPERRRSAVLDHLAPLLAALVRCPPDRQTRNCDRLAPRRLSPLWRLIVRLAEENPDWGAP